MLQENDLRQAIITEAKKLLNTPFRHRGCTRHGLDCLGFGRLAYGKVGISLPTDDGKPYQADWYKFTDRQRYLDALLKHFDFISNPKIADIVLFKCYSNIITHGGIYLGNTLFIHAQSGRKVVISDMEERYWAKRFAGYMCYRGFLEG